MRSAKVISANETSSDYGERFCKVSRSGNPLRKESIASGALYSYIELETSGVSRV